MSDTDRFETFYNSFRPTIDRMSDAFLVETIHDGKAKGINKLIMAALIAEATFRGIRLGD
jgi:hypothetical protein